VEGVLAVDPTCDLALLKVMANYMPCLDVSTTSVPPTGTRVFAIGNPQGLSNTLSDGLVSGVRLDPHGMNVIQTTAAISPGSSGGPLLTADGTVVGVTTFQSSSGQNLNFAIPAERVHPLIKARGPLRKLATLKAMTPAPSANSDALLAALAALNRGDVRGASELLERADDRQRSIPRYWYVSGLLHTKLNNLPRAADAFKEATRLKADYVEAWERLADIYIIQGKHREAIDAFREIARARPLDTRAYHRAAHVHSWLREYDKALSLLDRALSINPRDGMAHAEKAICYMSVKRYDDAVASAEAALAIDRRLFVAHNVIGETRLLQKRYPEAVTALREALKIAPSSPETYVLLGEACHRAGDSDGARDAWSNADRFGGNTPPGKQARKRLAETGYGR
jgi:tetratricopeptide (TPR) repeat protein